MSKETCDCSKCVGDSCVCDCHGMGKKSPVKRVSKAIIYIGALVGSLSLITSGGTLFPFIGIAVLGAIIYRGLMWYKKKTGSKTLDETLEKVKNEGSSMYEHAKEKAGAIAEDAKEVAGDFAEKAKETYHDVKEKASHVPGSVSNTYHSVKHDVKEELGEMLDDAKEFVSNDDKKDNV